MKGRNCPHEKVKPVAEWRDSAGLLWIDDECRACGRIWRNRVLPFPEHKPRPAWLADRKAS